MAISTASFCRVTFYTVPWWGYAKAAHVGLKFAVNFVTYFYLPINFHKLQGDFEDQQERNIFFDAVASIKLQFKTQKEKTKQSMKRFPLSPSFLVSVKTYREGRKAELPKESCQCLRAFPLPQAHCLSASIQHSVNENGYATRSVVVTYSKRLQSLTVHRNNGGVRGSTRNHDKAEKHGRDLHI